MKKAIIIITVVCVSILAGVVIGYKLRGIEDVQTLHTIRYGIVVDTSNIDRWNALAHPVQ